MSLPGVEIKYVKRRLSRRDLLMMTAGALAILLIWGLSIVIKHSALPLKPEADHITSPWVPDSVKHWESTIDEMAKKYDVDPNYIAIIMTLESGGDAKAGSEADAHGLMQITPVTGKDIATKYLKKPVSKYDLWDPRTNIEFGTAYLAELRKEWGSWDQGPSWNTTAELVAAGYNGGPLASAHLQQGKGLHDVQTIVYSRDAFNMWRERHASSSPTFDRWKERGGQRLIDDAHKSQSQ
jgi:hypothetical protein